MKMRTAVVWASVAALIAWIAVWGLVWVLARFVPDGESAKFGQVGDMFGAGSALFSGVAVAAVAVVLVFDVNERKTDLDHRELVAQNERLSLRPYVVGHVAERDARIERSEWLGDQLQLAIVISVSLSNQTRDPALNVAVKALNQAENVKSGEVPIALPLATGDHEPTDVALSFFGGSALTALSALGSSGLPVLIVVEYSSLNGTRWRSEVEYVLSASQSRVQTILPKLRDREGGETIASGGGLGGGTVYYLKATAKPGSWRQGAERSE
ncbi:hypothetical protein DEI93_12320 [Curtobacterium sp. MCBD17_035]|uniref:hypothetical protein n=1 Tax=Curtobacterium sp. MCBD17_035 TaxID=2175673 RepID=UPI0011B81514|nr:hypothetical protein [Curtobacterium sp. MCBD17_035]WIB66742.1 hypothetical protein DEI93_12320 [Curtobacterium sp. MCBD17_035]